MSFDRLLMKEGDKFEDAQFLGNDEHIPSNVEDACRRFVVRLYGQKLPEDSLNELRSKMAKKKVPPKKLPPTENSFYLHLLRAVLQLLVWKNAHIPMQAILDPLEFGFKLAKDGCSVLPMLMTQTVGAPELLNDVFCQCADYCNDECVCHNNNQPCTSACICKATDKSEDEDNYCQNLYTLLPEGFDDEVEEND